MRQLVAGLRLGVFSLKNPHRPTTTKMKQLISEVLQEKLEKATYQSDRASVLTKEIADAVKSKLKGV